jgi:hypothetical protein
MTRTYRAMTAATTLDSYISLGLLSSIPLAQRLKTIVNIFAEFRAMFWTQSLRECSSCLLRLSILLLTTLLDFHYKNREDLRMSWTQ